MIVEMPPGGDEEVEKYRLEKWKSQKCQQQLVRALKIMIHKKKKEEEEELPTDVCWSIMTYEAV